MEFKTANFIIIKEYQLKRDRNIMEKIDNVIEEQSEGKQRSQKTFSRFFRKFLH